LNSIQTTPPGTVLVGPTCQHPLPHRLSLSHSLSPPPQTDHRARCRPVPPVSRTCTMLPAPCCPPLFVKQLRRPHPPTGDRCRMPHATNHCVGHPLPSSPTPTRTPTPPPSPFSLSQRAPCHTRFLRQNRVLIVCMTQDQMFHTYGQKG
jgi:hypothetical protein